MIHVLQAKRVLPSLQDLAVDLGQPPHDILGMDCRYCTDPVAIAAAVQHRRNAPQFDRPSSLGALFVAFFRYFAKDYRGGTLRIRNNPQTMVQSQDTTGGGGFLFVENPFEPGVDVANINPGKLLQVREAFRKACNELDHGASIAELLAECQAGSSEGNTQRVAAR